MARPKNTTKGGNGTTGGESVSGYFRKIFKDKPALLQGKSNTEVLEQWLKDHPDQKEIPKNIKSSLSNLKSVLRSKKRKRGRPKKEVEVEQGSEMLAVVAKPRKSHNLETLEERIDDCLRGARKFADESLASVIVLLRKARNEVVWKIGQ